MAALFIAVVFFLERFHLFANGQLQSLHLLHLHTNQPSIGVAVPHSDLPFISSNVLAAESWLKSNVLAHYPSIDISTIVVAHGVLCNTTHHPLLLPSLNNLYFSLSRWGILGEIKVSPAFSSHCFDPSKTPTKIIPLLAFIHSTASPYTVDHASEIPLHLDALKKLGFPEITDIRVVMRNHRKLTSLYSIDLHSKGWHCAAPPSPVAEPPDSGEALWCVAKPTVPTEKLQEALDYACGEGKADCREIAPNGNCFYPDNLVAHASYAFNGYWQKAKKIGGSCNFDGAALLITSDPSFLHCHFELK